MPRTMTSLEVKSPKSSTLVGGDKMREDEVTGLCDESQQPLLRSCTVCRNRCSPRPEDSRPDVAGTNAGPFGGIWAGFRVSQVTSLNIPASAATREAIDRPAPYAR